MHECFSTLAFIFFISRLKNDKPVIKYMTLCLKDMTEGLFLKQFYFVTPITVFPL